jgi:8-hydroxy-5-deazaflavin:NADPH oxidoreductase
MEIGIIGAGGMGRAISRRLAVAGESVLLADRSTGKAREVASAVSEGAPGEVRAVPTEDGLGGDIVVLALWYPGTVEVAEQYADRLGGKIVVDISNPLDESWVRLSVEPTTSGAELVAGVLPESRVVKAFNTTTAPPLERGELDGTMLDTFVAGDDDDAKRAVIELASRMGLRALDAGALENARLLERLTAFQIELGNRYGIDGFAYGFKYLPLMAELTPAEALRA